MSKRFAMQYEHPTVVTAGPTVHMGGVETVVRFRTRLGARWWRWRTKWGRRDGELPEIVDLHACGEPVRVHDEYEEPW